MQRGSQGPKKWGPGREAVGQVPDSPHKFVGPCLGAAHALTCTHTHTHTQTHTFTQLPVKQLNRGLNGTRRQSRTTLPQKPSRDSLLTTRVSKPRGFTQPPEDSPCQQRRQKAWQGVAAFIIFLQLPQSQQGPAKFPAQHKLELTSLEAGWVDETWEGRHKSFCCGSQELQFNWEKASLEEKV